MQAAIRKYSGKGSTELFDVLEKRKAEVESLIRSVQGFVSYTLARSGAGGFSLTICQNEAGIDESTRRAKEWIAKNAGHIAVGAPEVSVGQVIIHMK